MRLGAAALWAAGAVAATDLPRECGTDVYVRQDIAPSVNQWCVQCPSPPYECFSPYGVVTFDVQATSIVNASVDESKDALKITAHIGKFDQLLDPLESTSSKCHTLTINGNERVNTTFNLANIAKLTHLERLTIDHVTILTNISEVSPPNMTNISISNCLIESTTPLNFTTFDHLISLNITKSSIETFPFLAPSAFKSLEVVDLSNNALRTFPKQVLQLTASNVSINLSGNLFTSVNLTSDETKTFNALVKSQRLLVDPSVSNIAGPLPQTTGSTSNNSPSMVDPKAGSKSSGGSTSTFSWFIILTIVVGCCIVAGVIFVFVFRYRRISSTSSTLAASFLGSNDRMQSPFSAPAVASPQCMPSGPFPALASYSLIEASEFTRMKVNPASGIISAMYNNERVLLKKLDVHSLQYDIQLEHFLSQLERIALLNHPNIVLLLGASKLSGVAIAGVFEFAEKGSLASLLANSNVQLSWAIQLHMATGLAEGLHYLHENSEDQLKNSPNPWTSRDVVVQQDYDCKWSTLTWFQEPRPRSFERYGSAYMAYTAPECVLHHPATRNATEVFTLGVILGEIATRLSPYASWIHNLGPVASDVRIADCYTQFEEIQPHPMDSSVPEPFQMLVHDCLARDPSQRPTARDVVGRLRQIV